MRSATPSGALIQTGTLISYSIRRVARLGSTLRAVSVETDPRHPKSSDDNLVYATDAPADSPYFRGPVQFLVVPNRHIESAIFLTDGK
jgi:hypothetical protein